MADEPTDPPAKGDPEPEPKKADVPPEVAAALKKANKEAETLRLKLKEIEDRDKSEGEKLAGKVTELEKQLADARKDSQRYEVALEKGLTKTQARRLVGDTEDELTADADDLLASFKPANGDDKHQRKPAESLKGGGDPTNDEPAVDVRKIVDSIPRGGF